MRNQAWTAVYNCLYLTSSRYNEVAFLESPVFEVLNELDTELIVGFNDQSLSHFVKAGLVDESMSNELSRFRDFVMKIDRQHWNTEDFDHLEDWNLARDWATSLMKKLRLEKKGWNADGEVIIYTKKS